VRGARDVMLLLPCHMLFRLLIIDFAFILFLSIFSSFITPPADAGFQLAADITPLMITPPLSPPPLLFSAFERHYLRR
jgi:hypothetical protein